MKTLFNSLFLLLLLSIGLTSMSSASPVLDTNTGTGLGLSIFKGKTVNAGSSVVAKVVLPASETVQAVVTTSSGKEIMATDVTLEEGENQLRIHLGELPSGLYFLKIFSGNGSQTRTFYVM